MQYYKITEVAKMFSVTRKTIYNWIESGVLKIVRINGKPRISEEECKRIIEEKKGD